MRIVAIFIAPMMVLAGAAHADITVTLNSGPVTSGVNFNWTYTATLKSGSTLNSGDFFTIYDVGTLGPGFPIANPVLTPASSWSSSIQLTGINGFAQAPIDSGSIYNITYTYTGASAVVAVSDFTLGGGAGVYGYTSGSSTSFTGAYAATSHATIGGAAQGNSSTVTVAGNLLSGIRVALFSGPAANGTNFNWAYTATLKSGSTLNSGDFFTIYDVGGFGPALPVANPVIIPASGWSSSIQLAGTNGSGQSPTDSSTLYNVTFTYTGASPIVAASDTTLGVAGAFGVTSLTNGSASRPYSATTHATSGGAIQGDSGTVTVPGPLVSCLDPDGNGAYDALTDGLIIVRALFGLTGTAVTNAALGTNATRADWNSIRSFLNGSCGTTFGP